MLVVPTTNALSERSYCPLRGIKNYVRSTMTQKKDKQTYADISIQGRSGQLIDVANDF